MIKDQKLTRVYEGYKIDTENGDEYIKVAEK